MCMNLFRLKLQRIFVTLKENKTRSGLSYASRPSGEMLKAMQDKAAAHAERLEKLLVKGDYTL